MTQFANPEHSMTSFDPFPFTNANLTDLTLRNTRSNSSHCNDAELTRESNMKKPLSQEERRAEHNAIERARRETLNAKFQALAQALPNLMSYRRPSKSQIVEKALDWVKQGISREERYRSQIIHLQRENKQLLAQLMQYQQDSNSSSTSLTSNSNSTASHVTAESVYAGMNPVYPWPVPGLMNSTQPMASSGSMDDISRQSLSSPRTDDEDNISSTNEEETEYQTSPYHFSYQITKDKQYFLQSNGSTHQVLLNSFCSDIDIYPNEIQANLALHHLSSHFQPI
ncbi:hypothetical protein EDC96DRAFT_577977 [Choanephora cucurbitarum]|nr:hypothetical protein EDC96DRAFT_577977 [Choanephora cucurbitarum]